MPQRAPSTPLADNPKHPTLIYDGECGVFQDAVAVARFGIALPALAAAMHLVLPDGRVYPGADAVPELLRLFPGKRWLAPLFWIPGVLPLARRIYAQLAMRRHCLVRSIPGR